MKRNRIFIIIIIVLAVALAVSVWQNISSSKERVRARQYLLNAVFSTLTNASRELDDLISFIENNDSDDAMKRDKILDISDHLVRADTLLKQYQYSNNEGLNYMEIYGFGYISQTLRYGQGVSNDTPWNGVLLDNIISENERLYLTALRDDISHIIAEMKSTDDPFNENRNLTISQLNSILRDFSDKWSYHNENSPYFLVAGKA